MNQNSKFFASYSLITVTEVDSDTDSDSETVPIVQTRTRIATPYFCVGQESDSESAPESASAV